MYHGLRADSQLFPQSNSQTDLLAPKSWRKVSSLLHSLLNSFQKYQQLYCIYLLAASHSLLDLSSLIRDWTCALGDKTMESNQWLPGNSWNTGSFKSTPGYIFSLKVLCRFHTSGCNLPSHRSAFLSAPFFLSHPAPIWGFLFSCRAFGLILLLLWHLLT